MWFQAPTITSFELEIMNSTPLWVIWVAVAVLVLDLVGWAGYVCDWVLWGDFAIANVKTGEVSFATCWKFSTVVFPALARFVVAVVDTTPLWLS